ncbi:MAG: SAM-dependent methyltransferase, partial [Pseudomonadota bacterium]
AYIAAEDLDFQMASPMRYREALEAAGFVDVQLTNRNPWYREQAKAELARLEGPEAADFAALLPDGDLEGQLTTWRKMIQVLETGEHCPHHLRGRKP